jgi:hypothetical protein
MYAFIFFYFLLKMTRVKTTKKTTLQIGAPAGATRKVAQKIPTRLARGGMRINKKAISTMLIGPVGTRLVERALAVVKKKFGSGLKRPGAGLLRAGEKTRGGRRRTSPRK